MLADVDTSPISGAERALLRFVAKVNRESITIGPADMDELHRAGWTDEAIYDAINVCALFNFYNRWIDAAGVCEMSEEGHRQSATRLAERGYNF